MTQQEQFQKVNQLLEEALDENKSMDEKYWRTSAYANALGVLIGEFNNRETFKFMLRIQEKIYEKSKKSYGNECVILATIAALGDVLGSR